MHQTDLPKSTHVVRSLAWSWPTFYCATFAGIGNATTDRENNHESDGANVGNVERRDEETCVLCATEREGLSSRTGSMRALGMREPREQPGGREREALPLGKSEREGRKEIAHRSTKWRKGERSWPNGASLSSATGLRNTHISRPPASSCTLCTQSLTVNHECILNTVLKL